MARKRAADLPPASRPQQTRNDDPKTCHKTSPRDLSPDNKIDNLKTLNQLLLKETMEKRFQVDQLKSHIEDMEESNPLASDLEREVSRIVTASAMAEEAKKVRSLQDMLGHAIRERDEMRKELGIAVKERDSMKNMIGELGVKVKGLEAANVEISERLGMVVAERDEVERLWRKTEEGFDALKDMMEDLEKKMEEMSRDHGKEVKGLKANLEVTVARILELENEGRRLLDANRSLEVEISDSNKIRGWLVREGGDLRLKAVELEQRNGEAVRELDRLRSDILVLEEEKEAMERELEAKSRALELELAELRRNMGEISRDKAGLEMVRSRQEDEILGLKKEMEELRLTVVDLETLCVDSGEKNARLVNENDAMKEELAMLEDEMREKADRFEAKVGELSMKLDDLSANMSAVSLEKDVVENARAQQDMEIARLKGEVEMLRLSASELEEKCGCYGERNAQLQGERDELRLQVVDLKKSRDERLKELKQLNASLDAVLSEKIESERCMESLTMEKVALQKSLSVAEESAELLTKKMRAADVTSEKVLSLLKSTAEAMNEAEMARQNGAIDDEEIHPFARELESIKCAFKSRVGALQADLEDAKKKKPSLLMWLYPASTVAAILVAYAARCR